MSEVKAVKNQKWYEEQGGFGLEVDDVVYIDPSHAYFGGRFAVISGPSNKPNHSKGYLQNPKTAEAQGTNVVIDNSKTTVIAKDGLGNDILPEFQSKFEMEPSGLYKLIEDGNEEELQQAQ